MIREATIADIDALLALWARAEATPSVTDTSEDLARVIAAPHAAVLVEVENERVVGSLIATFDGWRANMYRMAVDPACRRQGIARRLVAHADAWLRDAGAKRVSALVEGDRAVAHAFWQAAGFTPYDGMLRYVRSL